MKANAPKRKIFDAVDMPLDVTIDEIKEILVERINRMHSNSWPSFSDV